MGEIKVNVDGRHVFTWIGGEKDVAALEQDVLQAATSTGADLVGVSRAAVEHLLQTGLIKDSDGRHPHEIAIVYFLLQQDTGTPSRPGKFRDYFSASAFEFNLCRRPDGTVSAEMTGMSEPAPIPQESIVLYCECMEEVKRRVLLINEVVSGRSPCGHEDMDAEVVCLNLRKSLELIAFSSLSAHKEAYAQAHANFAAHWRAKRLLAEMAKIHRDFYPQPISVSAANDQRVRQIENVNDGFLTADEFVFLYDQCSEVLHTRNPFRTDPRIVRFGRPIAEWIGRIERLLDLHMVHLAGSSDRWIIQMRSPEDGKVHAFHTRQVP
jgi:hypothetical protein